MRVSELVGGAYLKAVRMRRFRRIEDAAQAASEQQVDRLSKSSISEYEKPSGRVPNASAFRDMARIYDVPLLELIAGYFGVPVGEVGGLVLEADDYELIRLRRGIKNPALKELLMTTARHTVLADQGSLASE